MPKQLLNLLNASSTIDFFMKLGLWFMAILGPIYDVVGAILLLIAADFALGYRASRKQKMPFSWAKVMHSINKVIFYSLIVFVGWVIESKIIPGIPFMRLMAGFLALQELRSILSNFKIIFGIDLWDYIRAAIKRKSPQEIEKNKKDESD